MCKEKNIFDWCVVGDGAASLTAISKLLDRGVEKKDILWIAASFNLGDLGKYWRDVPANTKVSVFQDYLKSTEYFGYDSLPESLTIKSMKGDSFCKLSDIVEPLMKISEKIKGDVSSVEGLVYEVNEVDGLKEIKYTQGDKCCTLSAKKVILGIGSVPVAQSEFKNMLELRDVLSVDSLRSLELSGAIVGIFGGSHSAVLAIMNVLKHRANVINIYKHPLRYAISQEDGIIYDNTGLKGEVADWSKKNMHGQNLSCMRVHYQDINLSDYLKKCHYIVNAIGFKRRSLPINGMELDHCPYSGIISYGIYGCGIAYPEKVIGLAGNIEWSVGLNKFSVYMDRVLPIWMGS